jgi:acetyl esterase/lipase
MATMTMSFNRVYTLALTAALAGTLSWPTATLAQGIATAPAPSITRAGVRELRDVPYVKAGHERQRLDLFIPPGKNESRPLVIWIHGGGWSSGSKDRNPAKALLLRGYAVAGIGYRLSQHATYPAQIEDCKAAIRWLRANAKEYGIDPKRIGVWGASAGGHLASLVGTTGDIRDFDVGEHLDQPSTVQCVLNWFGPADFLNYGDPPWPALDSRGSVVAKLLGGPVFSNTEKARLASPVYFAKASASPFLIMQGDRDHLVPLQQSQLLHNTLQKVGAKSELLVLPGAGHGGSEFTTDAMKKRMVDFFEQHL